jgi:hypothetical protein
VSAGIAIGILGAALVHTHTATPTAGPSPFTGTGAQGIAIPVRESGSAAIAQRTPASTSPPDMTVPADRDEGSPAPAAPEKPSDYDTLLRKATMLSAGDRRSGIVLSVGRDSLVVDELGRAGEKQKLHVTITRKTRVIELQRNPAASGAQDAFTDKTISLAEVKKGDYVVVYASHQEAKLVAESVIVTLRKREPSRQARP